METDVRVQASEGDLGSQELASEGSQEQVSAGTEATSQETDLQAQLNVLRAELEATKAEIPKVQGARDREVAALQAEINRRDAAMSRSLNESKRAELKQRAREDPNFGEWYVEQLDSEESLARIRGESYRQGSEGVLSHAMADTLFGLTYQEKVDAYNVAVTKVAPSDTVDQMTAKILHEFAVKSGEKAKMSVSDERIKGLEDRITALTAAQAGQRLRENEGPEPPLSGGGTGSASYRFLEEAEAAHVRGDIDNARMRVLRRTLRYARET